MGSGVFIILSAILHAAWNTFAKRNSTPYYEVLGIMSFATIFSLVFIPFFSGPLFETSDSFLWALTSGLFEGGYIITLAISLSQSSLGKAYIIMRGSAMVIVWFISACFLGENINLFNIIGISSVFSGLILTSQTFNSDSIKTIILPCFMWYLHCWLSFMLWSFFGIWCKPSRTLFCRFMDSFTLCFSFDEEKTKTSIQRTSQIQLENNFSRRNYKRIILLIIFNRIASF
ncbi:hypothetical protein lpari_02664 [Legionella parisiensis]|uniref:EamA domain-containing protein n=1 Tax=Legionella parisiensis TaxID=45071 RepID=A0A1E5JP55_9GAMM|nr:hypothetical protein lpari_02664 [Legionella parisiensis]